MMIEGYDLCKQKLTRMQPPNNEALQGAADQIEANIRPYIRYMGALYRSLEE